MSRYKLTCGMRIELKQLPANAELQMIIVGFSKKSQTNGRLPEASMGFFVE